MRHWWFRELVGARVLAIDPGCPAFLRVHCRLRRRRCIVRYTLNRVLVLCLNNNYMRLNLWFPASENERILIPSHPANRWVTVASCNLSRFSILFLLSVKSRWYTAIRRRGALRRRCSWLHVYVPTLRSIWCAPFATTGFIVLCRTSLACSAGHAAIREDGEMSSREIFPTWSRLMMRHV